MSTIHNVCINNEQYNSNLYKYINICRHEHDNETPMFCELSKVTAALVCSSIVYSHVC